MHKYSLMLMVINENNENRIVGYVWSATYQEIRSFIEKEREKRS